MIRRFAPLMGALSEAVKPSGEVLRRRTLATALPSIGATTRLTLATPCLLFLDDWNTRLTRNRDRWIAPPAARGGRPQCSCPSIHLLRCFARRPLRRVHRWAMRRPPCVAFSLPAPLPVPALLVGPHLVQTLVSVCLSPCSLRGRIAIWRISPLAHDIDVLGSAADPGGDVRGIKTLLQQCPDKLRLGHWLAPSLGYFLGAGLPLIPAHPSPARVARNLAPIMAALLPVGFGLLEHRRASGNRELRQRNLTSPASASP
jgi:hypothetical protein